MSSSGRLVVVWIPSLPFVQTMLLLLLFLPLLSADHQWAYDADCVTTENNINWVDEVFEISISQLKNICMSEVPWQKALEKYIINSDQEIVLRRATNFEISPWTVNADGIMTRELNYVAHPNSTFVSASNVQEIQTVKPSSSDVLLLNRKLQNSGFLFADSFYLEVFLCARSLPNGSTHVIVRNHIVSQDSFYFFVKGTVEDGNREGMLEYYSAFSKALHLYSAELRQAAVTGAQGHSRSVATSTDPSRSLDFISFATETGETSATEASTSRNIAKPTLFSKEEETFLEKRQDLNESELSLPEETTQSRIVEISKTSTTKEGGAISPSNVDARQPMTRREEDSTVAPFAGMSEADIIEHYVHFTDRISVTDGVDVVRIGALFLVVVLVAVLFLAHKKLFSMVRTVPQIPLAVISMKNLDTDPLLTVRTVPEKSTRPQGH